MFFDCYFLLSNCYFFDEYLICLFNVILSLIELKLKLRLESFKGEELYRGNFLLQLEFWLILTLGKLISTWISSYYSKRG